MPTRHSRPDMNAPLLDHRVTITMSDDHQFQSCSSSTVALPLQRQSPATPLPSVYCTTKMFVNLTSVLIKCSLSAVCNWFILKEIFKPMTAWSLAAAQALASLANRTRYLLIWHNSNYFPPHRKAAQRSGEIRSLCLNYTLKTNQHMQTIYNWSLNLIAAVVQIWHALIHTDPKLPQNILCLPATYLAFVIPAMCIAIQYKANRIDKQKNQISSLSKNLQTLSTEKQHGKIALAATISFGTLTAFALTSFFVLKTILSDFINFILIKFPEHRTVDNPITLNALNYGATAFVIITGFFQSICTSSIIFRLFKWKEKVKPHLRDAWKASPTVFLFGILNNLVYSSINILQTIFCTQSAFYRFLHQGHQISNSTLPSNTVNCSSLPPHPNPPSHSLDSFPLWMTVIGILFAVLQATPLFFNNLLYNFLPNTWKAETKEKEYLIKHGIIGPTDAVKFGPHAKTLWIEKQNNLLGLEPLRVIRSGNTTWSIFDRGQQIQDEKSQWGTQPEIEQEPKKENEIEEDDEALLSVGVEEGDEITPHT